MKRRFLIAIFGAMMLALGGALVGAYAYDHSKADLVATGVSAAGIDLSGMTEPEARAALVRAIAPSLQRPAVVIYQERRFTLPPSVSGVRADVAAMTRRALLVSLAVSVVSHVYQ